jgi:uncharacterized membrane protein YedE/YeeE
MNRLIAAVISGLLFGFGLSLSEMTNRHRVLGFLDVTGNWDASLMFVMGGAVLVTLLSFRFILKRSSPVFDRNFHLPVRKHLDGKLIAGSALFGIGWGIAGYCPGPAIVALASFTLNPLLFFLFFILGSYVAKFLLKTLDKNSDPV